MTRDEADGKNSGREADGNPEAEHDDDASDVDWARMSIVGALGAELAGFLVVGLLGGNYLDEQLGTSPLFLLIGLVVAIVAAGLQLWRLLRNVASGDDR